MKTIFFKLLLILFILLAIILLYQPTKEKDSLYKGKENEDVYVSVQVGDNIQKILLYFCMIVNTYFQNLIL